MTQTGHEEGDRALPLGYQQIVKFIVNFLKEGTETF